MGHRAECWLFPKYWHFSKHSSMASLLATCFWNEKVVKRLAWRDLCKFPNALNKERINWVFLATIQLAGMLSPYKLKSSAIFMPHAESERDHRIRSSKAAISGNMLDEYLHQSKCALIAKSTTSLGKDEKHTAPVIKARSWPDLHLTPLKCQAPN